MLRATIGARGLLGFFNAVLEAVFVLYIVRVLDVLAVAIATAEGTISGGHWPATTHAFDSLMTREGFN